MAAPIFYRWDDANAPVARGERRSLCDILRACLVDGYGTKPAAGWTLEFINVTEDKAAFRNNPVTGTGYYLQIDGPGGANDYQPKVRGFETMTSEDDGLGPFYNGTVRNSMIAISAGTTARPWILVADDRAFYFVCWPGITTTPTTSQVLASPLFFGDLIPADINDLHFCGYSCCPDQYGSLGQLSLPTIATGGVLGGIMGPRKANGDVGPIIGALHPGGGPSSYVDVGAAGAPWAEGELTLISRPYVNDAVNYTFRGWLPGYYYPCHQRPFGQWEQREIDGKQYISLLHYMHYGATGNCLISLDDWRA